MAGKAKSVYVSIVEQSSHKTVERRTCFNAKGAKEYISTITEKYPKPEFYYVTETY